MRALLLSEKGRLPECKVLPTPNVNNETQALVELGAAGLNHRDLWIMKGQYAGLKYPIIPGSDGAGWHNEEEVVILPGRNWGERQEFQSTKYQIMGLPEDGTFAEYVLVERAQLYPKPRHLSMEEAAALPLAGLTAYRVLFSRCKVKERDKVLVTGIGGGVALFAAQFALAIGCKVFVTSGSDEKLRKAMQLGISGGGNYRAEGWAELLKSEYGGFDVIIDGAGGGDFNQLIRISNSGARIGVYGGTNGSVPNFSPQAIFWKQISILGSTMGSEKDFEDMLSFVNRHQIKPIVDGVFDIEEGGAAFQRMESAQQFGKIVLSIKKSRSE